MIAVLRTVWTVSLASYAGDNGIAEEDAPRELGWYLTASINDLPAVDGSDAWATSLPTGPGRVAGGIARVRVDWRIRVTPAAWLAARDLPTRAAVRPDLLEYLARELYGLPSVCETDAVMVAQYLLGRRMVRWEFRPQSRRRGEAL